MHGFSRGNNMASDERFITLDSAAFMDRFPSNSAVDFSNILVPPLDNRNYDLQMRVLDLCLSGNQNTVPTCFDVSCDLIEPYQKGDSMTQTLMTFLSRRKITANPAVSHDLYVPTNYSYAQLRESHSEFDRFTFINMKIVKTFGDEQVPPVKSVFVPQPKDFDVKRVMIRLHIVKSARSSSKEAETLYLARI